MIQEPTERIGTLRFCCQIYGHPRTTTMLHKTFFVNKQRVCCNETEMIIRLFEKAAQHERKQEHTESLSLLRYMIPKKLQELYPMLKVRGSMGLFGKKAEIPWVNLMWEGVTNSAQRGYYVVLFLDKNKTKLVVSLSVGYHALWKASGEDTIKAKVLAMTKAATLRSYVHPQFLEGKQFKPDLGATQWLGKRI